MERPRLANIKPSNSMIVPKSHSQLELHEGNYPPDDPRSMSPRRNPEEIERLLKKVRSTAKKRREESQSTFKTVTEQLNGLREENDKLKNENKSLQDYVEALRGTKPKEDLGSSRTKK